MPKITPVTLRQLVDYSPETGALTWLRRSREWFKNEQSYGAWNTKYVGRSALGTPNNHGHLHGNVFGVSIMAHRAAWAITHGVWPRGVVDHINGVRSDNRMINLRDVSRAQNSKNLALSKSNKSGVIGVHWDVRRQRWIAQIRSNNKRYHLGSFLGLADAVAARQAAEKRHGFHPNHGRAN